MNKICIKREELYKEVWYTPIARLAPEYGLSDVGLAKICKKMQIPRPARGYWAKVNQGGAKPHPKKLPTLKEGGKEEVWIDEPSGDPVIKESDNIAKQIAYEASEDNKIIVPDQLEKPHKFTRNAKRVIRKVALIHQGEIRSGKLDIITYRVSPECTDRVLRISDTLVKAFAKRGFDFVKDDEGKYYHLEIFDERIDMKLYESIEYNKHEATPQELARNEWDWSYHLPYYDHTSTGKLTLSIDVIYSYGVRCTFRDGKKQRVEDCLNDFIVSLVSVAERRRIRTLEHRKWQKEYEEEQQRKAELKARQDMERKKLNDLYEKTDSWKKAKNIRKLLEAIKKDANLNDKDLDEAWLKWAYQQADRLDPLKETPYSVLDEKVF